MRRRRAGATNQDDGGDRRRLSSSPGIPDRVVLHSRQGTAKSSRHTSLQSAAAWEDGSMRPTRTRRPRPRPGLINRRSPTPRVTRGSAPLSAHDLAPGKLWWRKPAPPAPRNLAPELTMVDGSTAMHSRWYDKGALTASAPRRRCEMAMAGDGPATLRRSSRRLAAREDHHACRTPWSGSRGNGTTVGRVAIKPPYEQIGEAVGIGDRLPMRA